MRNLIKLRAINSLATHLIHLTSMPSVLPDSVAIELLIEGRRGEIFRKIIRRVPPRPPKSIVSKSSRTFRRKHAQKQKRYESFLYSVLESYLSEDGSERVFKVRYQASEYYYYAFEFNNHVVCPAFLVGLFGLNDYACLNVIDDSEYWYIFFEKSDDDPPPDILNDCFDFPGQYYFSAPTDEFKVLQLDFGGTNMECFIKDNTIELKKEMQEFMDNPPNQLKISKCNPSYVFVPDKIKREFLNNYHPVFPFQYNLVYTILVHSSSKSYLEIERLLKEHIKDS